MGGTGHCKIQDLSVGQKEVWGKLAKCYREEGKSENTICNMKLFGQGIYCLLSQRQHVEGRKEGKEQEVFVLGGPKGSGKHCYSLFKRDGVERPCQLASIQILFGTKLNGPPLYFQSADLWKWSWENEVLSLLNKGI